MKQPNDTKTADIFAGEKRGRGRPKLDNAKSAAERARQYRLNKKTRPQVTRPLAAAADEIGFLRDQVTQLCNDLRETEKALEVSEENCDLHLAEISRLRSDPDNCVASQKNPLKTSARIGALESENRRLMSERHELSEALVSRDQMITELKSFKSDASQNLSVDDVVRDLQRELNRANAVIMGLKDDRVLADKRCADLAQRLGSALVKTDSSRKTLTKKDALEEQFDYPD